MMKPKEPRKTLTQEDLDDIEAEMTAAFSSGEIFDKADDDFEKYMRYLTTRADQREARGINRCFIIDSILTTKYLKKINRRNLMLTWLIIALTLVNVAAVFIQLAITSKVIQ